MGRLLHLSIFLICVTLCTRMTGAQSTSMPITDYEAMEFESKTLKSENDAMKAQLDAFNRERQDSNAQLEAVRAELEEDMASVPGPDVANVYWWSNPCTTYCAWQILNGGTRTFSKPRGENPTKGEQEANAHTAWLAKSMKLLSITGKCLLLKTKPPMGGTPKRGMTPRCRKPSSTQEQ